MTPRRSTILVAGMIAADQHQGGAVWAVLQYVLGLRRLGHRVHLVEPIPAAKLQPAGTPLAESINARFFREVVVRFGLEDCATAFVTGTDEAIGVPLARVRETASAADALINISGMLREPSLAEPPRVRVYLDLDPAFNQLWHAQGVDVGFDGPHTHFVTVGLGVGRGDCAVPTRGRRWITTRQPIALEEWPAGASIDRDAFTTVGNWRGYGAITHDGRFYGQKAHSFRDIAGLPTRTRQRFELAMSIHPAETADLQRLAGNGWTLLDPQLVAGTPDAYRAFVQGSKAEIAIAKQGYAAARSGWFSDRSICYLASGRPVVAQETGFSDFLPAGDGLLSFTNEDEALAGVEQVAGDYDRHSRAARAIAEEWFDSNRVLPALLRRVEVSA